MPDATYDKIRKERCKLCANGLPLSADPKRHWDGTWLGSNARLVCTAPTRDEVIEELIRDIDRRDEALRQVDEFLITNQVVCELGYDYKKALHQAVTFILDSNKYFDALREALAGKGGNNAI